MDLGKTSTGTGWSYGGQSRGGSKTFQSYFGGRRVNTMSGRPQTAIFSRNHQIGYNGASIGALVNSNGFGLGRLIHQCGTLAIRLLGSWALGQF
jgi:hypothetical protein